MEMLRNITPSHFDEFKQDWLDDRNLQCLQYACHCGFLSVVERLIESGVDVNTKLCGWLGPPLNIASFYDHLPIVKLLLARGANPNGYDDRGSALQIASENGSDHIVQLLLEHGADVDFVPDDTSPDTTPLNLAIRRGHTSTMTLLLDKGADINARGEAGNALFEASAYGHEEYVRILLNKGAYLDEDDEWLPNPLQGASAKGYMTIVELLLDHGASINRDTGAMQELESLFEGGICSRRYPIVKLCGTSGRNYSTSHPVLGSALHAASARGQVDVAKLLIERGADGNARNLFWGTPLQLASDRGQDAIIQLLTYYGAEGR